MHLIWTTSRIFLKPIPRFLLEPCFWTEYLYCGHEYERCGLRKCALSFLFSYAALLSYESDFRIAEEKRLLPLGV
ncbi:hypothetical protein S40293_10222 [Stachybotrys chartarum IBT 40293]|nr:hypothetical protein S40293_10222 [Stachybotrys chartarum IBT 40293]